MSTSASAFSGDGNEVIERTLDVKPQEKTKDVDLENVYELSRCESWINGNNYKMVSLQFPDELLVDSAAVASHLQNKTSATIFILGDTSYGSCCVDEVAAQHYNADAIIHFGHACLSPTKRYPVLYVFGRQPIDPLDCYDKFQQLFPDKEEKIVVVYDTIYAHATDAIIECLLQTHPNTVLSKMNDISGDKSEENCPEHGSDTFIKCGRTFPLSEKYLEEYSMFFIGAESLTLTNLIMSFCRNKFYTYNPETRVGRMETLSVNQLLGKRFRNIDIAKDANIVGIVAGTLGVANYLDIINRLKAMIKTAGKKSYTFVMGKINVPKMANFMEIDVFVLVACPENSIINSKEFYKPIITPYEMELACNRNREWDGKIITDYRELLPGGAAYVDLPETMEVVTDISLVTGSLQRMGVDKDEVKVEADTAVVKRDDMTVMSGSGAKHAAEYLQTRSWQGLQENLGETPVVAAEEGRKGIAMQYTHENSSKTS